MRTVKIAYTPPQRRSLGEKLRYKLAVRRKGGPVWARIGDTRQMVRRYPGHNSRRAFVQAVLAYGCSSYLAERLLNPRRREEVRFAVPYCPAPGDRLYHWAILDNMADIRAHGLRPTNRSGYVYYTSPTTRTTSQTAAIFTGRWAVSGKTPPLCCWKLTPVLWPVPNPLCGCWSTTNLPYLPCRRNL